MESPFRKVGLVDGHNHTTVRRYQGDAANLIECACERGGRHMKEIVLADVVEIATRNM